MIRQLLTIPPPTPSIFNMFSIHYIKGNYSGAIKCNKWKWIRFHRKKNIVFKVCCNIGNVFVNIGKYRNAIHKYEYSMGLSPDPETGVNIFLCDVVLGHEEKNYAVFH